MNIDKDVHTVLAAPKSKIKIYFFLDDIHFVHINY